MAAQGARPQPTGSVLCPVRCEPSPDPTEVSVPAAGAAPLERAVEASRILCPAI